MSSIVRFWWHPRSARIGEIPCPLPVEECVLAASPDLLRRMRERFEQLCRNGWYGEEWTRLASGRRMYVVTTD